MKPIKRARVAAALAAGALVAGMLSIPAAARAGVDDTDNGYSASVSIHFYGNGLNGRGTDSAHTASFTVHPSCWWAAAAGPYQDAAAMLKWYDDVTGGSDATGLLALYGPRSVWEDAAAKQAAGDNVSWYRAYCKDPADYTKYHAGGTVDGAPAGPQGGVNAVVFLYHAYGAGEPIPAPLVPPAELARAAYAEMKIPVPLSDRNPMIAGQLGQPTLVGLPTWFWVRNEHALGVAGGGGGELTVTAEIFPPTGRVFATVTALTKQLKIHSQYGERDCSRAQALHKYVKGQAKSAAANAAACTVTFTHASTARKAGLAVTATSHWTATWVGSDDTAGVLEDKEQVANMNVPVAEVQNIVTR